MAPAGGLHKLPDAIMLADDDVQNCARSSNEEIDDEIDHDAITKMNHTTSPLLRLPAELRNKIFRFSIVQKKFILENLSRVPVPIMSNVGLLSSCRQINHEAAGLVAYPSVLQLGKNIYPHRFFRAKGENSGLTRYNFNWSVRVLEIDSAFFKLFSSDSLHYYLDGYVRPDSYAPRKIGWLLDILPLLRRIEVHGYRELHSQHDILKEF